MKARVSTAEVEGLDPAGGRWLAICDRHSTVVNNETRDLARRTDTVDFCEACMDEAEAERAQWLAEGGGGPFEVGDVVAGFIFDRPFFKAEVIEVVGDNLVIDVFHGNSATMGRQTVPVGWCKRSGYRLVVDPEGGTMIVKDES